jgi:hypothetical protein
VVESRAEGQPNPFQPLHAAAVITKTATRQNGSQIPTWDKANQCVTVALPTTSVRALSSSTVQQVMTALITEGCWEDEVRSHDKASSPHVADSQGQHRLAEAELTPLNSKWPGLQTVMGTTL